MVDGTYEKVVDKEGIPSLKYQARTPEEVRFFNKLVKNAIGFNEERGDQVEVVSMPFALSMVQEPEPDAMQNWREIAEGLAKPLVYLLIAVAVMLLIVRPFLRLLAAKPFEGRRRPLVEMAEGGGGAGMATAEEDLSLSPRGLTDQERIYRLAQSDPDRAADLVRRWLREEKM
jgi:flagellar M-ring protein FliF